MKAFDERFDSTAGRESRRVSRAAAEAAWLRHSVAVTEAADQSARPRQEQRIREAAYFKAERREFAPGHELEDWLQAEREADRA